MQEKWFSHDWMVKKRNVGHSGKSGELRVVRGGGGVGVWGLVKTNVVFLQLASDPTSPSPRQPSANSSAPHYNTIIHYNTTFYM